MPDVPTIPLPDRTIHEPARLSILTVLSSCSSADFLFLENLTGLSRGNLSVQLSNLESAGLVEIQKEFAGKKPHTVVRLTTQGLQGLKEYWRTMDTIRARAVRPKRRSGRTLWNSAPA